VAFGQRGQPPQPTLPPYKETYFLADHYFRTVQAIERVYQPQPSRRFELTIPETVMIHMVIAIMKFQQASRNDKEQGGARLDPVAVAHYHYAISFVPELFIGHRLEHMQALAMICLQLRQQPRLGAAWSFTNSVMGFAIELGLHRTASAWPSDAAEQDPHVVQMRRRVFWSLMVLHVSVGGKLGRPMPLRIQDMDLELPDHLSDLPPGKRRRSAYFPHSHKAFG
jgi:hypothetical protein